MTQFFIPPVKPIIGEGERAAADWMLRSGMIAQGPEVAAFETEFSEHFEFSRACVAANFGTPGLHLGLLSCGIDAGDGVIVSPLTLAATVNSVALTGAISAFADISADDFILDPASVEVSITEYTKTTMPVHLYGHPAQMDKLCTIADSHSLLPFEDVAQAHGASPDGALVGAFGEFTMFSLYLTKNMTSGKGDMVSRTDAAIGRNIRLYRNQGMLQQCHNEIAGLNNRMTDIHAVIGRVQPTKVDAWMRIYQENAAFLSVNLEGVIPPPVVDGAVHVYYQYTIRVSEDRDGLAKAFKGEYQVGSGMFYPIPNHRLKPFQSPVEPPEIERAAKKCLSLPVHPSLTQEDLERIVNVANTLAKAGA